MRVQADESGRESVLGRAFRLLDSLALDGDSASLVDLARATGLPKPTVYRLAGQLVELGVLEKEDGRYRPGEHLFQLGSLVTRRHRLREAALPFIADLYEVAHETVHLCVLDKLAALYIDKFCGHRSSVATRIGSRKPLHCTAVGKALLAFSPPDVIDAVTARGLSQWTRYSLRTGQQLRSQLLRIAEVGVAYDTEEYELGITCVASPVLDRNGLAVAALSVSGVTTRFKAERYAPAVRTAALGLARLLNATPEPF